MLRSMGHTRARCAIGQGDHPADGNPAGGQGDPMRLEGRLRASAPRGRGLGMKGKWGSVLEDPSAPIPPTPTPTLDSGQTARGRAPLRMVDGGELAAAPAVRGLRDREHLGSSCQNQTTLRPADGWGQWPGSLCPSVTHRNFTPSLEVGGLRGGGSVCSIPSGLRAVPCPEVGDCCLPRLPGAHLTCQKCWALPAYSELPERSQCPTGSGWRVFSTHLGWSVERSLRWL